MAEPLQTLFSSIRRPRPYRRTMWEPAQVQGGDSPGMRGSINPLDSVAMTDAAQGVDITSIDPPTRLVSDQIDEEMYQEPTPVDAGEEGGGERSPFQFASSQGQSQTQAQPVQYRMDCSSGVCRRVPVMESPPQVFESAPMAAPQMMASALPEGVTLGPGETYVPGSLRESGGGAIASAPMAATQGNAVNFENPMAFLDRAQQKMQQAMPYATSNPVQAVPATMLYNSAQLDVQTGMAALMLQKKSELAAAYQELANRGLDQKDRALALAQQKLDLESGAGRQKMDQEIREQRDKPIAWRASQIVRNYADDRSQISPMDKVEYGATLQREQEIITAQDLAWYMGGWLQATDGIAKAKASGGNATDIAANAALIDAKMRQMLFEQFSPIKDPTERAVKMRALLTPVYTDAYKKHLSASGQTSDSAVQASAINAIDTHIVELDEMVSGRASPYDGYFGLLGKSSEPQAASFASQREEQAAPAQDAPAQEPARAPSFWESLSSGPW